MEEKPVTKRRAKKKSATNPQAENNPAAADATPKADKAELMKLLEACAKGAKKKKAKKKDEPKIPSELAEALLDAIEEAYEASEAEEHTEEAADDEHFEAKGVALKCEDGSAVRTLFVGSRVFAEFPLDSEGRATAWFPVGHNDEMGEFAVTFPAEWLAVANAEQLKAMKMGATIVEPDCDDCCGCCDLDDDDEADEEDDGVGAKEFFNKLEVRFAGKDPVKLLKVLDKMFN